MSGIQKFDVRERLMLVDIGAALILGLIVAGAITIRW
jgi:hypothetical protein